MNSTNKPATEIPRYTPKDGESVDRCAKRLGLRVMARRDVGEHVAVIVDDGMAFRCVKVSS